ncbi:MAG TPA: protein tyrosine phosphatase, partial [Caulobacteraceae bacterium]
KEAVLGAKELFEQIEYPAMMHCKSGADRAGMMSVLYMHFRKGLPISEAIRQLSLRFGHIRASLTGVIDYSFEKYINEAEPLGISYEDWVQSDAYDHAQIKRDFRAQWWGTLLSEKLLRRE